MGNVSNTRLQNHFKWVDTQLGKKDATIVKYLSTMMGFVVLVVKDSYGACLEVEKAKKNTSNKF